MPPLCVVRLFPSFGLHTEPAVESNAVLIGNVDNSRSLVVNLNLLLSVTAALVRSVYHDFVNQIIQDFRREFLGIGVFANLRNYSKDACIKSLAELPKLIEFSNSSID